jgi:hypothetical protein
MNTAVSSPRALLEAWLTVLLAPVAWAAALGILYSLVDETCTRQGRGDMLVVGGACLALAIVPAPIAWRWRRHIDDTTSSGQRARFMLELAGGASLLFALVTLISAVPIVLLDPCRT